MKAQYVTAYIVVTALLLWWLLGRRVTATVTVPQDEIRVKIPVKQPNVGDTGGEEIDPAFVDSLPFDRPPEIDPDYVDSLPYVPPPRFAIEPPPFIMGTDFGA
jgi:hypothetical protein